MFVFDILVPRIQIFSEVQSFNTYFEAEVEVMADFEFAEACSGNLNIFQNWVIIFRQMTDNSVNYLRAHRNLGADIWESTQSISLN